MIFSNTLMMYTYIYIVLGFMILYIYDRDHNCIQNNRPGIISQEHMDKYCELPYYEKERIRQGNYRKGLVLIITGSFILAGVTSGMIALYKSYMDESETLGTKTFG
jgi:hypothetical protein